MLVSPLFYVPRIENPDHSSHLCVSFTTATIRFQHRLLDQRGADRPRGCMNVLATYGAEIRCIVHYGSFSKVIFGLRVAKQGFAMQRLRRLDRAMGCAS